MDKQLTLEEATEKLEDAISRLETKPMPFKEAVEVYAEASNLLAFCFSELIECKGKITDLNETLEKLSSKLHHDEDENWLPEDEDEQ